MYEYQKKCEVKRQVEIFTANCPVCDPVVKMINGLASDAWVVITYDLVRQFNNKTCLSKMKAYGIHKIPAVAVDGKLLECCKDAAITKERLLEAGFGQH